MKHLLKYILFVLAITCTVAAFSQNATKDANGNYSAIKTAKTKEPGKATGKTFTDSKGKIYPVFESAKGKIYYIKTSKSGNEYKVYLKL